jgi:hypothetical protein
MEWSMGSYDGGYNGFRYASGAPSIPVRQKKRIRRGHCRICGCTDKRRCVLAASLIEGWPAMKCEWANRSQTLCTAPKCIRADIRERKAKAKAAGA